MDEKRNEQKITFSFKHAIDLQMYVCSILIWANDTINSSEMVWNCGSWQQTVSKMKQEVRFQLYCFIIFYYFLPLSFLLICLYFLPSILLQFHLCKKKKNSSFLIHYPFSLLPSFHYLILGDTPALPAGSLHISVICVRTDKPDWYSSSAVARGWRQWHQSAGRMTCLSVTTNDRAEIFWS